MHSVDDVDGGVDMILQSGPHSQSDTERERERVERTGQKYRAADLHQSSVVLPPRGINPT